MANRFLSNLRINDAYTFPDNDGSVGQAIVTDGAGNLTFGSVAAASADSAESTHLNVKNTSGASIAKGTPVYVTGSVGNTDKLEIAPADASNASHMPAIGLLESTLANNGEGFVVQGGLLKGLVTDTIDGSSSTANDTVYVKAGGGLTLTKPTGSTNFIQNIAKVARVHSSNGSLIVSSILRTNDVPNLPEGKIWVGDGNTTVSTIVHLDELNGNVGIGTTSPASDLHIADSFPRITLQDTDGSDTRGFIDYSGDYLGFVSQNGSSYGNIRFRRYNGTSTVDSMYITSSGNVGIGTTSPTRQLTVNGTTSSFVNIKSNTTNGLSVLAFGDADDDNYAQIVLDNSQNKLQIQNGGGAGISDRGITIDSSENVGIGESDPDKKLHITDTSAGNVTYPIRVQNDGTTTGTDVGILFTTKTSGGGSATSIIRSESEDASGNNSLVFTTPSGGSQNEKMRITSGGNVGIGVTDPQHRLHMNGGATRTDLQVTLNSFGNGVSDGAQFGIQTGGTYIWNFENNDLYFATNNSRKMTIKPSGNVGIGTTSPGANLHVYQNGLSLLLGDDTYATKYLSIRGSSDGLDIGLQANSNLSTNGTIVYKSGNLKALAFKANTSTSLDTLTSADLFIDINGNVGIGTSSPNSNAKLDVYGGRAYFDATNEFTIRLSDSGTIGGFIGTPASGTLGFYSSTGTERMRIDSSGRVGIGTASPYTKLTINSGIARTSTAKTYSTFVHTNDSDDFRVGLATAIKGGAASADRYVSLEAASYQVSTNTFTGGIDLALNPLGGNVGIGTANPANAAKLTLMGNQTFGLPGNGANTSARFISIEGNTDSSGEGSGRVFFTEHNSSTAAMDNYGMSLGYRGGSTSIVGASGNTWTGLTQIGNGEWGMFGHDNNAAGVKIMQGSRSATYTAFYSSGSETMRVTGGNVGIGTANVSNKLSLSGNGQNWITSPAIKMWDSYNSKGWYVGSANNNTAGDFYIRSVTAENLYPVSANQEFTIKQSGNVGIGTTSPASKLHIIGNASIGTTVAASSSGLLVGGKGAFGNYVGSGDFGAAYNISLAAGITAKGINMGYNATADAGFIGVVHNGAGWKNLLLQPIAGNVGIGTTSASTKLEVSSTAPSGDRTLPHNVLTLTAESSGLPYNGFGGAINFKNRSYTYGILNSARIRSVIDSDSASNRGAGLAFDVTNSSQVYNTSLFLKYNGNVGIGTTSPASKLEIGGATGSYSSGIGFAPTGTGARIYRTFIGGDGSFRFDDGTAGVTRLMISSVGNVGIGSTNPSSRLEVISSVDSVAKFRSTAANSNVNIGDTSSTTSYSSVIFNTNSGLGQIWKAGTAYSSWGGVSALNIYNSNGPIAFHPNNSANAMFLSTSGNVGIGTASPSTELEVKGITGANTKIRVSTAGNSGEQPGIQFYRNASAYGEIKYDAGGNIGGESGLIYTDYRDDTSSKHIWKTRNVERMRISSEGSVTANVDMRAPIFYDSDNTGYYLNPNGYSSLSFVGSDGLSAGRTVIKPLGGEFTTTASTQTGAIKVTLPHIYTNTMLRMTIKVYEYSTNKSFEINCGGYTYAGDSDWINSFAYIIGNPSINRNFNVRFGHDGSKCCVYIGETNSSWSYMQIVVTDVKLGYSYNNASDWDSGWDVGFATSFGDVSATITNCQVGRMADVLYDTNDTNYYVDPASLSILNQVNTSGKSTMKYAVSDLNSVGGSVGVTGFKGNFQASNRPGSGNYATGIEFTYHDSSARTQLAAASSGSNDTGELWVRSEAWSTSSWSQWWKLWHQGNDGSGSGLDADLLDGIDSGSFVRSDANDTLSGQYTFTKTDDHAIKVGTIRGTAVGSQTGQFIQMYERVNIGGPSGWGASNTATPGNGLSTYGGTRLAVYTDYTESGGSMRAPIFYDSDSTGYYLNPASTSNLNQAKFYAGISVNSAASSTSKHGISLYGTQTAGMPPYGLAFTGTAGSGTHGSVTSDWATYFTMTGSTSRGWIFKHMTGNVNVASISSTGVAHFNGDVVAYSSSDERLKDNKKNINNALEKVESLNGVEFDWNDKQDVYEGHDIGVIAQEVEKIAPELVSTRDNGYKAVKYEKLVPLLIEAIKELSDKVKALENK